MSAGLATPTKRAYGQVRRQLFGRMGTAATGNAGESGRLKLIPHHAQSNSPTRFGERTSMSAAQAAHNRIVGSHRPGDGNGIRKQTSHPCLEYEARIGTRPGEEADFDRAEGGRSHADSGGRSQPSRHADDASNTKDDTTST